MRPFVELECSLGLYIYDDAVTVYDEIYVGDEFTANFRCPLAIGTSDYEMEGTFMGRPFETSWGPEVLGGGDTLKICSATRRTTRAGHAFGLIGHFLSKMEDCYHMAVLTIQSLSMMSFRGRQMGTMISGWALSNTPCC